MKDDSSINLLLNVDDAFRLKMLARIYHNTRQSVKAELILKRMFLFIPNDTDALLSLVGLYCDAGN